MTWPSLSLFLSFWQSIDPGQQFTWENSNSEVNKPKNRYANVIAYDHSRVLLTSIDGEPRADCDLTPLLSCPLLSGMFLGTLGWPGAPRLTYSCIPFRP